MDAQIVNPFIESTLYVLETSASLKATITEPFRKTKTAAPGSVSCMLAVSGESQALMGTVAISFSKTCILGAVSNMFGETMTELDDEIKDAAGEIANMIAGQATTKLAESGQSLVAKLSDVLMQYGHDLTHLEKTPVIAVPYKTEVGDFMLEFCFSD